MKTFKRILVSALAVLMVFTMLPVSVMAADNAQTAAATNEGKWIAISNAADFRKIGTDETNYPKTGNYYLTQDIDFSDNGTPLTVQYLISTQFTGVLDGNNHVLKGFKLQAAGNSGVFYDLGAGCVIRNLQIGEAGENKGIEATIGSTTADVNFGFLGALGRNRNIIENVHIYGNCVVNSTGRVRAGGFVGYGREMSVLNCSFTGSIKMGVSTSTEKNIAGVSGLIEHYNGNTATGKGIVVKDSDINITIESKYTSGNVRAAGIIGYCGATTYVDNCTISGRIENKGHAGAILGNNGNSVAHGLLVATDCDFSKLNINNKICGANSGRVYARGCTAQNTEAFNFAEEGEDGYVTFAEGFAPEKSYVWLINDSSDFAKIGATVKYKDAEGADQTYTYAITGFYRLADNITMDGTAVHHVVSGDFNGVLDGNGNAIKNIKLTNVSGTDYAGFFETLGGKDNGGDAAILDVSFGSADSYASANVTTQNNGIIAGSAGATKATNKNNYVFFNGVDVYTNVTRGGTTSNFGVMVGRAYRVGLYDCNTYGSVNATTSTKYTADINVGGLCGTNNVDYTLYYDCNSYVDIEISNSNADSTNKTRAAGFVAYNANITTFIKCNSFGNISAEKTADAGDDIAGGFIANGNGTTKHTALDCSVFGKINSKDYASGFAGYSKDPTVLGGFGQFSQITGTTKNDYMNPTATTVMLYNYNPCSFEMREGASVRLSSDTGIRFKGIVSDSTIDRLESIFGEDSLSYGMLITPWAFYKEAGAATHEALDAYAKPANGFAEGEKAYVDIVAEDWFKGERGTIAGSIVKLPVERYNTGFTGVAYISVGDYTIYASNPQTRSIKYVAEKALDDTTTEKNAVIDGYTYSYELAVGETYFDNGEKVTVAEGQKIYSCYDETDRQTLRDIIDPPAQGEN